MQKNTILFLTGFHVKKHDPIKEGAAIKQFLENRGFKVFVSHYTQGLPTREPLTEFVRRVDAEVKAKKPDCIIAHCMGGLIARKIIENPLPNTRISRLIMLETPNLGTTPQRIKDLNLRSSWPSVKDMLKGSKFITELNRNWWRKPKKLKKSYFQIGGQRTSEFPGIFSLLGVRKTIFRELDHLELIVNPKVFQRIAYILNS